MKFLNSIALVAVTLFTGATVAKANSIVLSSDSYSYDVGGEFSAATSPQSFLGNYVSSTIVNGGFETFCVETAVDFNPGSTYTYTLSNSDSQGRALSEGTAFLYYEFSTGNLANYNNLNIAFYNYNNASARKTDAGLLQQAIWWFQGKQTYNDGNYSTSITSNPFYKLAMSVLGSAAWNPNNGTYNVDIIQLWNSDGQAAQNQLVCLPDGGVTAALFGMGLVGLFLVQSRSRKSC